MTECKYKSVCLNNNNCYRCNDYNLYKVKTSKSVRKSNVKGIVASVDNKKSQAEDSWKDLEQQVADKLNQVPTIEQARRSIASGALWFEKGDIVDSILHPECKERTGIESKSGEKSISIKKSWLEKAAHECEFENKTMCLPFRFKGDKNIYCIFRNDDIAELITTMKAYMHDNECKTKEIELLKSKLKGE